MRKKVFALLLCVAVCVFCLSGCGNGKAQEITYASVLADILSCSNYQKGNAVLYDINNDNTKELMVCYRQDYAGINTNDNMSKVETYEIYQMDGNTINKLCHDSYYGDDLTQENYELSFEYWGFANYLGTTVGVAKYIAYDYYEPEQFGYSFFDDHVRTKFDCVTVFDIDSGEEITTLMVKTKRQNMFDEDDILYFIDGDSTSSDNYDTAMLMIDVKVKTGIDNPNDGQSIQQIYDTLNNKNTAQSAISDDEKMLVGCWFMQDQYGVSRLILDPNHNATYNSTDTDQYSSIEWASWYTLGDKLYIEDIVKRHTLVPILRAHDNMGTGIGIPFEVNNDQLIMTNTEDSSENMVMSRVAK